MRNVAGMTQSGESERGLAAAEAALAARDDELRHADRMLTDVVAGAHRIATESIRRIDGISADIDVIGAGPDARESARMLLDRNRELIEVVHTASAAARIKTVELQRISEHYTA